MEIRYLRQWTDQETLASTRYLDQSIHWHLEFVQDAPNMVPMVGWQHDQIVTGLIRRALRELDIHHSLLVSNRRISELNMFTHSPQLHVLLSQRLRAFDRNFNRKLFFDMISFPRRFLESFPEVFGELVESVDDVSSGISEPGGAYPPGAGLLQNPVDEFGDAMIGVDPVCIATTEKSILHSTQRILSTLDTFQPGDEFPAVVGWLPFV